MKEWNGFRMVKMPLTLTFIKRTKKMRPIVHYDWCLLQQQTEGLVWLSAEAGATFLLIKFV